MEGTHPTDEDHQQAANTGTEGRLDPVLMAVLANRFHAIVREMTNTLFRTGRSSVLNMARDFSCCIVTADDEVLDSEEGLQVHVLGAGLQTVSMRELHPDMAEGDAFLHNDPYLGNTHTADHTILVPVFADGEHLFTASAKAHQADCGNSEPSTYMAYSRDLYEEGGLNFPCVRIQEEYQDVDDIIRMCRRRIRVPDVWYGDYLAALGAARIGERRIKEVVKKYGVDTIRTFVREWLDYSERRMEHAIRQLPSGRLTARSGHDPLPGVPGGVPVTVVVTIDSEAGRIEVDLRDNIDCVPAGINLSEACSISGALIGIFNCLGPDVPHNAGGFRRVTVHLRDNCVVGRPRFPRSASMATTNVLERLINPVQVAFAQIGDGWGLAEGAGSMGAGFAMISGVDSRRANAPYVNQLIMGNNGGPASPVCDGWVTYCMPDSAMTVYIDSVEVTEQKYPVHIRSSKLLTDSGGAGRFRGGPAGEVVFGPKRDPMEVFYFADFAKNPPMGVRGGFPGSVAYVAKVDAAGVETRVDPIGDMELEPGELIKGAETGGGGYGNPVDRDPDLVRHDVLEKWVSLEQAKEIYGVVFSGRVQDESLTVDSEATAKQRDLLRTRREKGGQGPE